MHLCLLFLQPAARFFGHKTDGVLQYPITPIPSTTREPSEGPHCGALDQEWVTLSFSKLTAKGRIVTSNLTVTEVEESQRLPRAPGCGSAEKRTRVLVLWS